MKTNHVGQIDFFHPEFLTGQRTCESGPNGTAYLADQPLHFDGDLFIGFDAVSGQDAGHDETAGCVLGEKRRSGEKFRFRNAAPRQVRFVGHHDEVIQFIGQIKVETAVRRTVAVHQRTVPAEYIKQAADDVALGKRRHIRRLGTDGAAAQVQDDMACREFFRTRGAGLPVAARGCGKEGADHK